MACRCLRLTGRMEASGDGLETAMSIIQQHELGQFPYVITPDQPCFYCANPLTTPAVAWHGAGEPLYLHPPCVVEFAIRLFRDVHEIERTSHEYVTGPRSVGELRERLIREELRR